MRDALSRIERVIDDACVCTDLEGLLPSGVRVRQLSVRTLFIGILLALGDERPGHLTRVHRALVSLGEQDRRRLGVTTDWKCGPHTLTYRQVEHTFSVLRHALEKPEPDGAASEQLRETIDAIVEASVASEFKVASSSSAVDWSDQESFSRPPVQGSRCADTEASWGHRNAGLGKKDMFFGYYYQTVTMVRDETGDRVPELIRRLVVSSCHLDPPTQLVSVLERMVASGVGLSDVICDSGYAHRQQQNWAAPVRRLGAELVMDLHPADRGTRGTHHGAICFNGNLYCPRTPVALFGVEPLSRNASATETDIHDARCEELARYKLGRVAGPDRDGFERVMCPAVMGKVRCPARPESMKLPFSKAEVLEPPEHLPRCCVQQTITVGAEVNSKTSQKHDYPSKAHRKSFARRTGVERGYSTLKDRASTDTTRGWCRVMGLCAVTIFLSCAVVVRNIRITDAHYEREQENRRRALAGLPPRTRKRRRRTLDDLIASPA